MPRKGISSTKSCEHISYIGGAESVHKWQRQETRHGKVVAANYLGPLLPYKELELLLLTAERQFQKLWVNE